MLTEPPDSKHNTLTSHSESQPVQHGQSQSGRFIQQCLFSPVVLLLKVADGDESRSAAQSKLVLLRRPLHTRGCTVDAHQHQRGFPHPVLQSPHISVSVRGTAHDAVGLWGPVNT